MKKIIIINGPNLNLLGKRETEIYGSEKFEDFFRELQEIYAADAQLTYFQSNIEGEIVDKIQQADKSLDGIVLNAAGYTHTSVAIRDAISSVKISVIETHISNVYAREEFRHTSLIAAVCKGVIAGFGLDSYILAIDSLI